CCASDTPCTTASVSSHFSKLLTPCAPGSRCAVALSWDSSICSAKGSVGTHKASAAQNQRMNKEGGRKMRVIYLKQKCILAGQPLSTTNVAANRATVRRKFRDKKRVPVRN